MARDYFEELGIEVTPQQETWSEMMKDFGQNPPPMPEPETPTTGWAGIWEDVKSGGSQVWPAIEGTAGFLKDVVVDRFNKPFMSEQLKDMMMRKQLGLEQPDPFRSWKIAGENVAKGGHALASAPANARDYFAEKFPESYENVPSFRLPESILPQEYDYTGTLGGPPLEEYTPSEQLVGEVAKRLPMAAPAAATGPLAPYALETIRATGENENIIPALATVGAFELGPKAAAKPVKAAGELTGKALKGGGNILKKGKEFVTAPFDEYKNLGKQAETFESQAQMGEISEGQLGDYGTTLRRSLEEAQKPIDQLESQKQKIESESIDQSREVYSREQNKKKLEDVISKSFKDQQKKIGTTPEQQSINALQKVNSEAVKYGGNMYESLLDDINAKNIKKAKIKKFDARDFFEDVPAKVKESTTTAFRTNNLRDIHDAYKDLGKYISNLEAKSSKSGLLTPEIDALSQAKKIRANMKSGLEDAARKAGGEEFVNRFSEANKFWENYVTPFNKINSLRNVIRNGEYPKGSILETLESKGARDLKRALVENADFMREIGAYEWAQVSVNKPAAVMEAIEGDLGRALSDSQKTTLKNYLKEWKTEGQMIDSIKKELAEKGFTKKEINLEINKLNKEIKGIEDAIKEVEIARKSTEGKTRKASKEAEKARSARMEKAKKLGMLAAKIVAGKYLASLLFGLI